MTYDLEPLLVAALAARAHGEDWYGDGDRALGRAIAWLVPYATGEKVHEEYVRSTVAHGVLRSIDVSDALQMPGVVAVYTADDLGLQPVPSSFNPGISRYLIAKVGDKVRFVGEPVAAVLTEERYQGEDAAEAVVVDYDVLPAVVDIETASTCGTLLYDTEGREYVERDAIMAALGLPVSGVPLSFDGNGRLDWSGARSGIGGTTVRAGLDG